MTDFKITLDMEKVDCPTCGIIFQLPQNFLNRKRETHENFFCPNKHAMCYPVRNEDDPDVLKSKLADAQKQNAELKTQVLILTHQLEQLETKVNSEATEKQSDKK